MDGMLRELVRNLQNLEKDLDSLRVDVREIQQELLKSTKVCSDQCSRNTHSAF